jgi:hypothetical protein
MKKYILCITLIAGLLFSGVAYARGIFPTLKLRINNSGGPGGDGLLLETGDYLLLETGDYLLLE